MIKQRRTTYVHIQTLYGLNRKGKPRRATTPPPNEHDATDAADERPQMPITQTNKRPQRPVKAQTRCHRRPPPSKQENTETFHPANHRPRGCATQHKRGTHPPQREQQATEQEATEASHPANHRPERPATQHKRGTHPPQSEQQATEQEATETHPIF